MSVQLLFDKNKTQHISGTDLMICNSINMPFEKFKVTGNSKQKTRSEKNTLNVENISVSNLANIEYADGILTVSSTATHTAPYVRYDFDLKAGETVTFSGYALDANSRVTFKIGSRYQNPLTQSASKQTFTYTATEDISFGILLYTFNGETPSTAVSARYKELMLERNTAATEYEEYGVMPSPEFPSEIQNCGNNINLIKNQNLTNETYDDLGNKSANAQLILDNDFIEINSKEKHYFKAYGKINGYDVAINRVIEFGKDKNFLRRNGDMAGSTEFIYTPNTDCKFVQLLYRTTTLTNITPEQVKAVKKKFEKGTKATPYSPYNCGNVNFAIHNKNLTNYKDWVRISPVGSLSINENELTYNLTKNCYGLSDIERTLKPNTAYTAYCDYNFTGNLSSQWGIRIKRNETWGAPASSNIINFATDETGKITLAFYVATPYTGENATLTLFNIRLYEGTYNINNIPEYESYKSQEFTFPLTEGQRLYKDSSLADDGVHHKRAQIELNGTEDWRLYDNTNPEYISFYVMNIVQNNTRELICSHFKKIRYADFTQNGIALNNINGINFLMITIKKSLLKTQDVEGLKTWLVEEKAKGTPVILEYELAEEKIEPYTEEQQLVYDQIKQAYSYKDTTYVFCIDNVSLIFYLMYRTKNKKFNFSKTIKFI